MLCSGDACWASTGIARTMECATRVGHCGMMACPLLCTGLRFRAELPQKVIHQSLKCLFEGVGAMTYIVNVSWWTAKYWAYSKYLATGFSQWRISVSKWWKIHMSYGSTKVSLLLSAGNTLFWQWFWVNTLVEIAHSGLVVLLKA